MFSESLTRTTAVKLQNRKHWTSGILYLVDSTQRRCLGTWIPMGMVKYLFKNGFDSGKAKWTQVWAKSRYWKCWKSYELVDLGIQRHNIDNNKFMGNLCCENKSRTPSEKPRLSSRTVHIGRQCEVCNMNPILGPLWVNLYTEADMWDDCA